MSLGIKPFEHGLHDLGTGGYAWLQPDGGWGWSNAGLIVSQGEALLVDTLFDVRLTHQMLDAMRAAESAAAHIGKDLETIVPGHGPIAESAPCATIWSTCATRRGNGSTPA